MFWQQPVLIIALLIANGSDDIFGFFGHLIQEQVHHTQTPFTDMDFFFGTEVVGNLGKVSTNEWKTNYESILGWKFQTHLEMVLKKACVETKQRQI